MHISANSAYLWTIAENNTDLIHDNGLYLTIKQDNLQI